VSRKVLLVSQDHLADGAFSVALVMPEEESFESNFIL
jgi:hypothetical protein